MWWKHGEGEQGCSSAASDVYKGKQFVRAYRLRSAGASNDKSHMLVELLSDGTMADRKDVRIPAFQVASRNSLSFQFAMEPHKEGICAQTITNAARPKVDAD